MKDRDVIQVYIARDVKAGIAEAARAEGLSLSTWSRLTLTEAAAKARKRGLLRGLIERVRG